MFSPRAIISHSSGSTAADDTCHLHRAAVLHCDTFLLEESSSKSPVGYHCKGKRRPAVGLYRPLRRSSGVKRRSTSTHCTTSLNEQANVRSHFGPEPSYYYLGDEDDDVDSFDKHFFTSRLHKFGVMCGCTLLTLYFLPMLSFIPLALCGGIHMPNPWESGYNNMTTIDGASYHYQPAKAMPTGEWYWSLPIATCCVLFLPTTLLGTAYLLKTRVLAVGDKPLTSFEVPIC